jgi:hypothetical protein
MSVTANKQIAMVEVGGRATPNDVLMKCIDYGAGAHAYGVTLDNSHL